MIGQNPLPKVLGFRGRESLHSRFMQVQTLTWVCKMLSLCIKAYTLGVFLIF